jgi:predicted DNA-binding protein with PD1-like motif
LKDAFSDLWLVIKANPIGAVITALVAIGAAVTAFYFSMDKSTESTKKLNEQIEIQTLLVSNLKRETARQVELLKSQGASEQELIAIKQRLAKEEIFALELSIKKHEAKIQEINDNKDLTETVITGAAWALRKLGYDKAAALYDIAAFQSKQERKAEEKKLIDQEKQDLEDLRIKLQVLSNEKINADKKDLQAYKDILKEREKAEAAHRAEIQRIWDESIIKKQEADITYEGQEAARKQSALEAELAAQNEAFAGAEEFKTNVKLEGLKEYTEKEKAAFSETMATAQATNDSMIGLSNLLFDIAGQNATKGSARELELAKKRFKINKALAISSNIISTIVGVTNALSAQSIIPDPFGTILKVANAAAVGISGTVATAKIASQKFNEGGGGAGGLGGSVSLPTPNVAPPTQGSTQLNSDGTIKQAKAQGTQPIRAYVVETDVTTSQKKVSSIETNAKL